MTTEEAKIILQAYRPDGRDAQDPQFSDALEQLKRDPVLEKWFREQQALDGAVARQLQSVTVPSTLKSEILAGRRTLQTSVRWNRRSTWMAMAACLVAVLGLAAILLNSAGHPSFADYRMDMVHFTQNIEQKRESLQLESGDVDAIRAWIQKNSIHKALDLPAHLTANSGVGCRVIDWNGQSVALACFHLESGGVAHVLVIDRNRLRNGPDSCTRYIAAVEDMNTMAWSSGTKTYLVISHAPEAALQRLL